MVMEGEGASFGNYEPHDLFGLFSDSKSLVAGQGKSNNCGDAIAKISSKYGNK